MAQVATLSGHTDSVQALLLHRGRLASGAADNTIRLWDAESGARAEALAVCQVPAHLPPRDHSAVYSLTEHADALWSAPGPHMVHCHTVHLPLGALLIWCTMCGTGRTPCSFDTCARRRVGHTWLHCHAVHLALGVLRTLGALLPPCAMSPCVAHVVKTSVGCMHRSTPEDEHAGTPLPPLRVADTASWVRGRCSRFEDGIHHRELVWGHLRAVLASFCSR